MRRLLLQVIAAFAAVCVLGTGPSAFAARRRDSRPPTVQIASPAAGSVVAGTVRVTGSAHDNVSVSRVAVSVDGGSFALATGTDSWSLDLDSDASSDGTHVLIAKAWDRRGNVRKVSQTVTFDNGTTDAAADPQSVVTPEGTRIDIDSAGGWTADEVYLMLKENGLDPKIGPSLVVKVQDEYASQVTTGTDMADGRYTAFRATLYLKGVDSTFVAQPDATLAHEFGHVWTLYHLYLSQQNDWGGYLRARGLEGDSRLNSGYEWSPREIIAEDYRLLFGSADAVAQRDGHMNREIADPRTVPGLRTYLESVFSA
jgi:hypothetical protein